MNTSTSKSQPAVPRAFPVIVWGGLLAGALDATDGVIAYGFLGLFSGGDRTPFFGPEAVLVFGLLVMVDVVW